MDQSGKSNLIRRMIIGSAAELFARNGIRGVTLEDIAKEIGFGTSSLYQYFRNKEDLLVSTLTYMSETYLSVVDRDRGKKTPLKEKLLGLLSDVRSLSITHPEFRPLVLNLGSAFPVEHAESIEQIARSTHLRCIEYIRGLFEEAEEQGEVPQGSAADLAWAFSGIAGAYYFRWVMSGDPEDFESISSNTLNLFFSGAQGIRNSTQD